MADANSVSLNTNLNTSPYFDDFDESKNFHRVLFRPGLAVQARELTQLQTILQNQIDRFGSHVFKEGSLVQGGEFNYDKNISFVKLRDNNIANNEIDVTQFVGTTVTGNTSGVTARVVDADPGTEAADPDTNVLYVKYTNSGSNNTTKEFIQNEILNSNTSLSANTLNDASVTGFGSRFTLGEGIVFAKDHFIRVEEQSIVIGEFSSNVSFRIGYEVNEEIISSEEDSTLNDPARGAFNYNAPGANRLKLSAVLAKRAYSNTSNDENFIEIFRTKNSEPEFKADKPIYSQINDYLARRTFEESGNYVARGLGLRLRPHLRQSNNDGVFTSSEGGDVDKLSVDVAPGVAYIFGYRRENLSTSHVPVDKGIDTNSVEQLTTSTNYGNYVTVNEVAGNWEVNNQNLVSLRDEALNAVSNGGYSNTGGVGNEIGTARVKSLEYSSGTAGLANAQYNLHIYDINMSNGSFDQVRSIFSSTPTAASKADPVLVSNSAVLNETSFNRGVFSIPASYIKTIRDENGLIDTTFQFLKSFNVTIGTDGTFTVSTGETDEQYPFSIGVLNDTQVVENFDVVFNASVDSYIKGQRVDMTAAGASIEVTSSTDASFDIGDTLSAPTAATVITRLNKVDGREKSKTYRQDRYVKINVANNAGGTSGPWNLGLSDAFEVQEVRQHTSAFTSGTDGTDVTEHFKLDTGQKDNLYNHGKLKKSSKSGLVIGATDHLLVKLAYFAHDTSQGIGYFSVDSYPIDDSDTANTTAITTQEIPIFSSPVSGDEYDLRDSIDIRPRVTDTATDSTTVGGATTDPTTSTSLDVPSGGLHYSPPNENFLTDLEYYLPRVDKIAMDRKGEFKTIRGVGSSTPKTPPDASDSMTLAEIDITPYPSLTPKQGNNFGRSDLAVKIKPSRIRRYTMRDINFLDQRIENLEYYTSLTLLENDAKAFSVTDSQGLDRFKNGILVDNFQGGAVSDINNPDYDVAIDQGERELRPPFKPDQVEMEYNSSLSSTVQTSPADVILTTDSDVDKFIEGETVTQGGASGKFVYKVGFKVYLEDVSGTFSTGTITGATSGDSDTVTSVKTVGEGQLVTLPYSHDLVISQPIATGTRNIAGLLYTWFGELELTPDQDIWVETVEAPDVNINVQRRNDIWLQPRTERVRVFGRSWGWWNWRGDRGRVEIIDRNVETRVERSTDIIGTEIVPFMRSRVINFEATSLKPSSQFYAFFDGDDVNQYCRPTDSSFANTAAYGGSLITDSDGKLYGQFRIPNNDQDKFQTGALPLRLTDSSTDSRETGAFTSFAESDYTASGTRQTIQETIITTREISTTRRRVNRQVIRVGGNGGGGGGDPVAQTFRVNDRGDYPEGTSGVFLTKFDLYFNTKDDTQPLIVELREVDPSNGYVTDNVIPLSTVIVPASDVNISDDGSAPTPVYFKTPIFLQSDVDYAVVLKPGGDNPNYVTFVARMGERDLVSGARMGINPFTGVLFASSNDRVWTAIQEEDLKFNAYFADFGTNGSGTVMFTNKDRDYFVVNSVFGGFDDVGEDVHGETTLTLSATPTANVGEFASGDTSGANGEITLVSGSTVRVKDVTLDKKYQDGEGITYYFSNGTATGSTSTLSSQSTPAGKVHLLDDIDDDTLLYVDDSTGNFVANTQLKTQVDGDTATLESFATLNVDVLNPFVSKLGLNQTDVSLAARLATSTSSRDSAFINYKESTDNIPSSRRFILGRTDEVNGISGNRSAEVRLTISNDDNGRHSPAIDKSKMGVIVAENFVNDVANTASETQSSGGDAEARYITRTVTLADGQDAEDIRVILDAYRPSGSEVRVYYKILADDDSEEIEDKSWVEMNHATLETSFSDSQNPDDFIEYEYEIPAANLTGTNGEVQYTDSSGVTYTGFKYYKIKIVLDSSSTINPPRVRNFRTVALQA